MTLPDLIEHLDAVDFSGGYDFDSAESAGRCRARLAADHARADADGQALESQVGIVLGLVALFMFVVGLIAVGVFHIQAPIQEFNGVDTMVALTRDMMAAPQLQIYASFCPAAPRTPPITSPRCSRCRRLIARWWRRPRPLSRTTPQAPPAGD